MTYAESEYLCNGLKFTKKEEGKPTDFELCEDYIFRDLYLRYVFDLNGVTPIFKTKTTLTPIDEKRAEVERLDQISQVWEKIIQRSNHPTQSLNYLAKETRADIKELEKQPEFNEYGFLRRCNHFDFRKKRILLHSKFIYTKNLQIMSELTEEEPIYELNGELIEFTEYSYIHILSRHYAEIIKQTPNNKSYHIENFHPDEIVLRLKHIFKEIDDSGKYVDDEIHEVNFRFKGDLYRIWVNERIKSIKGHGNVKYYRLETFFPLKEKGMLGDLAETFEEKKLSEELSVFVKKA